MRRRWKLIGWYALVVVSFFSTLLAWEIVARLVR